MIDQIIKKYAKRLQITEKETFNTFKNILSGKNSEEELYNLIGYDDIEDVAFIIQNTKIFIDNNLYINKIKYYNSTNSYVVEQTQIENDDAVVKNINDNQEKIEVIESEYVNKHFDTQINKDYVEITLPTAKVKRSKDLISVDVLKKEHKKYFSYKHFNTVQSSVFSTAYMTNSNFLVSAPTGCGKTDIAFLTILKALDKPGKIVLLAPMKALATEIANKLKRRLKNIIILEYTGDTDPNYEELTNSKIFVATPEKFDAATRKMHMNFTISLLIIDEIHILQTERGAVIETIVCRMFRYVEIYQKPIRIVGLSATMPNYKDVGKFIRAEKIYHFDSYYRPVPLEISLIGIRKNREEKIEHFSDNDNITKNIETLTISGNKTVNINELTAHKKMAKTNETHTVKNTKETRYQKDMQNVKCNDTNTFFEYKSTDKKLSTKNYEKKKKYKLIKPKKTENECEKVQNVHNTLQVRKQSIKDKMNDVFIEKIQLLLEDKCQILVFVTSRRETENTKVLLEKQSPMYKFDIHHAGLPRTMRLKHKEMFCEKKLDVLITTSTLAWGVNLPAKCVIIKGTEFYNQDKGRFEDMGILDLLQIFGRAGRPQFDYFGKGMLITENKKLSHYFNLINNYTHIESQLLLHIVDILNSEIYLGTITKIRDAIEWFKSTFMFVRMLKVPLMYGFTKDEVKNNEIDKVLTECIILSIRKLKECNMIKIKDKSEHKNEAKTDINYNGEAKTEYNNYDEFSSTNIGRIASFYYLTHETVFLWQENINFIYDTESFLDVILQSTDFKQIILREDEITKLQYYETDYKIDEIDTTVKKMKILYYLYINGLPMYNFNLYCDQEYIIKNLERLSTAFLELCIYYEYYNTYEIAKKIYENVITKKQKKHKEKNIVQIISLNEYDFINVGAIPTVFYDKNKQITYIANNYYSFAHKKKIEKHQPEKIEYKNINHIEMLYRFGIHFCEETKWTYNTHKQNCKHFTINYTLSDKTLYTNDISVYVETANKHNSKNNMCKSDSMCDLETCKYDKLQNIALHEKQMHLNVYLLYKYKIEYEIVDDVHSKEKQKIITKKICNALKKKDTLIICHSFDDMIQTKDDIQTLLSIKNNAYTTVSYGGIKRFSGIFVTEYNDLLKNIKYMQSDVHIIFKGISDKYMYNYFDILKIVKSNICTIYETKNIVEYFSKL